MTSLLAARRENFAATLRFHADAEAVRLGAAAFARLICALRQNNSPLQRGRTSAATHGANRESSRRNDEVQAA